VSVLGWGVCWALMTENKLGEKIVSVTEMGPDYHYNYFKQIIKDYSKNQGSYA